MTDIKKQKNLKQQFLTTSVEELKMLSKKNKTLCNLHTKTIQNYLDVLCAKNIQEAKLIKDLLKEITVLKSQQRQIWSSINAQIKKNKLNLNENGITKTTMIKHI